MEKITINGVEYKLTPVENESPNSFEAKFHEGDWCYRKYGGFKGPIKITKVLPLSYEAVDYIGYHHSIEKYCLENNYHLWTIADAKDGDVLRLGCVIAMFKKYIGQEKCICYCSISEDGDFEIPIENGEDNIYGCTNATPATNEQRDTLFDKMKEAGYEWDFEKKELKKIEAKEAMHDKPKFKVGDWILIDIPCKVKGVDEYGNYIVEYIDSDNKETHILSKKFCESHFHLWTIKDAKDGDILVEDKIKEFPSPFIAIFKRRNDDDFESHCFIGFDGKFYTGEAVHDSQHLHPATEEQRDILFQKMKEAGYEWDSEKKELKKYTPIFTVGDTIIKKPVSDINFGFFTITDIAGGKYWYNDRIICEISEQNDWELVKQKPAECESETQPKQEWSEEDDYNLQCMIAKVSSDIQKGNVGRNNELIDWLKSIKNRIQLVL